MSNKEKKKKNEAKKDVQEKEPTLLVCTIAEATRKLSSLVVPPL